VIFPRESGGKGELFWTRVNLKLLDTLDQFSQ
jgi:hypothetical protein